MNQFFSQQLIKELTFVSFVFIILDIITLNLLNSLYSKQIEQVQNRPFHLKLFPAILCYMVLVIGLYSMVIQPRKGLLDAFFFGFFNYAVFELTNKSLFDKWTWKMVFIDTLWGGILFALTTYVFYLVFK
jgi:uncharacterized membrane protein